MIVDILYNIIVFIAVLSIIVFVHELGHYSLGRMCGVRVSEFSLGFGKKLWSYRDSRETEWKVCLIPLGGYVKFFGDRDIASSEAEDIAKIPKNLRRHAFVAQNLFKKTLIVVAGPMANFIFAIVILTGLYLYFGKVVVKPEISMVVENSVAAKSGMQIGDVVIAVDGQRVDQFSDLEMYVATHPNIPLNIEIKRNEKIIGMVVTPEATEIIDSFGDKATVGKLGVGSAHISRVKYGFVAALSSASSESIKLSVLSLKALGQIFKGQRDTKDISGVIRISKYAGKTSKQGLPMLLWFMAMISLNLGLVNLFPIPPLDGGHLFLYMIRATLGKKIGNYAERWLLKAGIVIILFLMVFAIINDIRYF